MFLYFFSFKALLYKNNTSIVALCYATFFLIKKKILWYKKNHISLFTPSYQLIIQQCLEKS